MLSFLLRLPFNIPLVALWILWSIPAFIGSNAALVIIVGCGFLLLLTDAHNPIGGLCIMAFVVNRVFHKFPIGRPPAVVWWRSRPRRIKPLPVPVMQTLTTNSSAPTVRDALARLSPALRRVIEQPPSDSPS